MDQGDVGASQLSQMASSGVRPCFVESPKDEVLKGFMDSRSHLLSLRRMEEKTTGGISEPEILLSM